MHESKHFLPGQFVHSVVVSCKKKKNFVNVCFVFLFIDDFFGFVSFLLCLVSFRFVSALSSFVSVSILLVSFLFRFLFYNHPFTKAIWL